MSVASTGDVPRVQSIEERSCPASLLAAGAEIVARHQALVRHCMGAKRDTVTPHYISTVMRADVWPDIIRGPRFLLRW